MQFVISLPDSERAMTRLSSIGEHAMQVESLWDLHTRTVPPMEALRLLTVAISDGLRVEAYP